MATEKDLENNEVSKEGDLKEYEIAFSLNPLLATEEVPNFVSANIREVIENGGGEIISSTDARMIKFSYPVRKSVDNKISTFKDGYFGSIKFKATGTLVHSLDHKIKVLPELIRMIVVESSGKNQLPIRPARKFVAKRPEVGAVDKPKEEMTEEAKEVIDKEIEEMVTS